MGHYFSLKWVPPWCVHVCMYVFEPIIHACLKVCVYVSVNGVNVCKKMSVWVYMCVNDCVWKYEHVWAYLSVDVCVNIWVCVRGCVWVLSTGCWVKWDHRCWEEAYVPNVERLQGELIHTAPFKVVFQVIVRHQKNLLDGVRLVPVELDVDSGVSAGPRHVPCLQAYVVAEVWSVPERGRREEREWIQGE